MDLSCLELSGFLDLGGYFLPHYREVFNYYLLKYVLMPFLLSSGTPMIRMLGAFNIVPKVSDVVLISFHSCFFFPPAEIKYPLPYRTCKIHTAGNDVFLQPVSPSEKTRPISRSLKQEEDKTIGETAKCNQVNLALLDNPIVGQRAHNKPWLGTCPS